MFGWKRLRYIQNKLCDSYIRETIANVSLIILFPAIFFYQTALGTRAIEPWLGSGWAFSVIVLFPCLSALYLFKFINERENIFLLDYLFCAFLGLTSIVAFINFTLPLPAQHNYQLLYWNIAGVISNATCFMAFRMANSEKRIFNLLIGVCAFLIIIIFLNLLNDNFYFNYMRDPYVMSYQGFARCAFIVFLFVIFSSINHWLAILLFIVFSFVLLGIQSRTELILFVCAVPAVVFFKNNKQVKAKMLVSAACLFCGTAAAYFLFNDLVSDGLSYFDHARIFGFLRLLEDESLRIRLMLTEDALLSISQNLLFGDYGSYLLRTNEAGHYSHNFLSVWVNLGLAGLILYCCLCVLVLKFCFFENTTGYRKHSSLFAGALGLSAVVAHVFSYPYVEVLLACSIGAISQHKETGIKYNKNSFD